MAQVAGLLSRSDGHAHAFLYSGSGPMQDLGVLTFTDPGNSSATGINILGQIVGTSDVDGISDDGNSAHRVQIMASGDRIYMVIYVGPKGQENSADATRFRNSFKLLK